MILSMLITMVLIIAIAYSFCFFFQNSYAQIEIPRTYVNVSQLQRIDQSIATYAYVEN
jgi:hypothetical protein